MDNRGDNFDTVMTVIVSSSSPNVTQSQQNELLTILNPLDVCI